MLRFIFVSFLLLVIEAQILPQFWDQPNNEPPSGLDFNTSELINSRTLCNSFRCSKFIILLLQNRYSIGSRLLNWFVSFFFQLNALHLQNKILGNKFLLRLDLFRFKFQTEAFQLMKLSTFLEEVLILLMYLSLLILVCQSNFSSVLENSVWNRISPTGEITPSATRSSYLVSITSPTYSLLSIPDFYFFNLEDYTWEQSSLVNFWNNTFTPAFATFRYSFHTILFLMPHQKF